MYLYEYNNDMYNQLIGYMTYSTNREKNKD
jgi:hypothetical protein